MKEYQTGSMSYLQAAEEVLSKVSMPLEYSQVWSKAVELGLDKAMRRSYGKTPHQTMSAQLYKDVKRLDSKFIAVSRQPMRFWLKSRKGELDSHALESIESLEIPEESKEQKRCFGERDLHPLLVRFINDQFGAYAKTIFHEKSIKGRGGQNQWIHPDIVGVHFPFNDYKQATLDLSRALQISQYVIYSFELKIAVDFNNLKESYFQAVSNSSFANEGYLVVFEDIDSEVSDEIRRLSDSFGIGLIKLDIDPMKSSIIFPARSRELDLQSIDVLADKNTDFRQFIVDVTKDMGIADKDRIAIKQYDKILSDEALEEHMRKKGIKQ